jgi:hypothetical protein
LQRSRRRILKRRSSFPRCRFWLLAAIRHD